MVWLAPEWDHRDPQSMLDDIDCGHYLQELQNIPIGLRQLIEDGNLHVEIREVRSRYRVVKIVKKREPEYLQGKDRFYIHDLEGNRIPLTEEEYDELLGIRHNPDDVFLSEEVNLATIDSEHTAPMDVWDVVFDATDYLAAVDRFVQQYRSGRVKLPRGVTPQDYLVELADREVYSADWFPYPADKRIHGARAKQVAERISKDNLTRQQLGALLGPRERDQRPRVVKEIRARAKKMQPCRENGRLLIRANQIIEQVYIDRKKYRRRRQHDPICDSDRSKLWSLWRRKQITQDGSIQLTSWQFERAYRLKLQGRVVREEITTQQAQEMLKERMRTLFGDERSKKIGKELISRESKPAMPAWLTEAPGYPFDYLPTREETEREEGIGNSEDEIFAPGPGWVQSSDSLFSEEEEEDWLQAILLSDGEGR